MNEANRNAVLWVIATFSVAALPQLARMPVALALLTVLPLGWRVASEFRGWKPLPPLLRHGMTVVALAALVYTYGDLSGRRAAVSLLTVMLSLKLVECYRIRDARLVVSFSLFLCATQFLFGQKVLMPAYSAAVTLLALSSLVRLQRLEAWQYLGAPPRIRASLITELGFSLRMLVLAVPIGLAFFILFPRLASPLWGIPETTLDAKSGLSDSMSPGSIQQLFMDDSPAFRVTFDGNIPPPSERYWRGPVFWRFDGQTWRDSFYSRNLVAETTPAANSDAVYRYSVQLEPNERKWLFALDYPVTTPEESRITVDFQIIRRDPVLQLLQYEMVSNPDFEDFPDGMPEELRLHALDLPEDINPKTREMIDGWRREGLDDRAMVDRAYRHFSQDPFRYTLNAPLLSRNSVDDFLFVTRAGFCEHYASSFAVMMRMAGIPARVVTGYMGGFYNELGDYMLIRQSDAHAWAEVWLEGQGWTHVDPTAAVSPARIDRGSLGAIEAPRYMLDLPWLRSAKNSIDIVQQRWNDWVIEYGAGKQAKLFAPLGLGHMTPTTLMLVLVVALALAAALIVPLVLRTRGPLEKDPVRKQWLRFIRRLEGAGVKASLSAAPLELAENASRALPGQEQKIGRVAELYQHCRYSSDPPPVADLKHAVSEFQPKKRVG